MCNRKPSAWWIRAGLVALVPAFAVLSTAHNTNTTHPRITALGGNVVEGEDVDDGAYAELLRTEEVDGDVTRIFLGDDPEFDEIGAAGDSGVLPPYPNFQDRTIVDGVVQEDHPIGRVLSHFYNAYTGERMPLRNPVGHLLVFAGTPYESTGLEHADSKSVAIRFFDISVETYGYLESNHTEPAKPLAYWVFGRSLHHLEDMNSVAHVSSDPHLTIGVPIGSGVPRERDDFEGHYVPTKLWNPDPLVTGPLGSANAAVVVNSFDQIWPVARAPALGLETVGGTLFAPSLARSVYNLAIFHGELEYPINIPEYVSVDLPPLPGTPNTTPTQACGMTPPLDTVYTGKGELALMFNDPGVDCGLAWEWTSITEYARWEIDGVGAYRYQEPQPDLGAGSDWWSARFFDGPCVESSCGNEEYFYIEQVMRGQDLGNDFDPADLVVPRGLRRDYDEPWHVTDNPVDPGNTTPILDKFAEHILPLGPAYTAGYMKMWFDIVNTPPYLKRVAVVQDTQTKYIGRWEDEIAESSIKLIDHEVLFESDSIPFGYVSERVLRLDPDVPIPQFVSGARSFQITLQFNEPIQTPTAQNFELAFAGTVLPFGSYSATPLEEDTEGNALDKPWNAGTFWRVDVPAGALADLDGRITLRVKARDKNNHWGGVGAELDDDPATPARRQRRNPLDEREDYVAGAAGWLDYDWHDENSRDINFEGMQEGDFAYTFGSGDESHVLLFDATPPIIDDSITISK